MNDNPYQSPESPSDLPPFEKIDERVLARWGTAGFFIGGAIALPVAYQFASFDDELAHGVLIGAFMGTAALIFFRMQFRRIKPQ